MRCSLEVGRAWGCGQVFAFHGISYHHSSDSQCLTGVHRQDEADGILMDLWFGAFEVPVDEVRSYTWDDLHPPLPPLPIDPFFPTWLWGLITSASAGIVMLIPLYCCPSLRLQGRIWEDVLKKK